MGILCKIFGHKDEAKNFWGEQAEYILFCCERCGYEHVYCSHEGKILPYDNIGREILTKMMSDKEFSEACHIHKQFAAADLKYAFSFSKKEEEYKRLREKYKISSNIRPACPVEMYKAGLWKDKGEPGITKKKDPTIKETSLNINNNTKDFRPMSFENNQEYTNEVQPVEYNFKKAVSKTETVAELEKLLNIYVDQEKYEKAAEIHKKIEALKGMK